MGSMQNSIEQMSKTLNIADIGQPIIFLKTEILGFFSIFRFFFRFFVTFLISGPYRVVLTFSKKISGPYTFDTKYLKKLISGPYRVVLIFSKKISGPYTFDTKYFNYRFMEINRVDPYELTFDHRHLCPHRHPTSKPTPYVPTNTLRPNPHPTSPQTPYVHTDTLRPHRPPTSAETISKTVLPKPLTFSNFAIFRFFRLCGLKVEHFPTHQINGFCPPRPLSTADTLSSEITQG